MRSQVANPKKNLLVVEDDPDLNRQLVTALGDAGYAVDTAFDGDGVALLTTGEAASLYAVAEQADGKLVAVGRDARSPDGD